jgi:DNA (cytosine-5)-methyltransferase 1
VIASDLFSGLGGFTEGARRAGARVTFAANHWPAAVEWHRKNHPEVHHECQDLAQMDMRILPRGGLLLAAPACQGFSTNGQPSRQSAPVAVKHQADRNTTWAVLAACDTARPERVVVENVPALLRWPVFPSWLGVLKALGYHVRTHVLSARAYGGAQERRRMILTAALRGPIDLAPGLNVEPRTIADCLLDDGAPGLRWRPIDSTPAKVQDRARVAQRTAGSRCLWSNVDSARGRRLDGPFPTVTTKSIGQFYLLDGDRCRFLEPRELARAQSFPDSYQLPTERTIAGKLIGNAIDTRLAEGVVAQVLAA